MDGVREKQERWSEGVEGGRYRSQVMLANLPLLVSVLTQRQDSRAWKGFFYLLMQNVTSAAHSSVYLTE